MRTWSRGPAAWSALNVGGASVVNDTVLEAVAPRPSAITYVRVDVPTKPAAPVNVTVPAETEYEPSPVTLTDVFVQLGAVSAGLTPHNLIDDVLRVVPAAAVSLDAGVREIAVATPPDFASGRAVGGTAHWNTTMP